MASRGLRRLQMFFKQSYVWFDIFGLFDLKWPQMASGDFYFLGLLWYLNFRAKKIWFLSLQTASNGLWRPQMSWKQFYAWFDIFGLLDLKWPQMASSDLYFLGLLWYLNFRAKRYGFYLFRRPQMVSEGLRCPESNFMLDLTFLASLTSNGLKWPQVASGDIYFLSLHFFIWIFKLKRVYWSSKWLKTTSDYISGS